MNSFLRRGAIVTWPPLSSKTPELAVEISICFAELDTDE